MKFFIINSFRFIVYLAYFAIIAIHTFGFYLERVKVGQIVKVKVLSADAKAKRIALSIKALQASELPKVKHGVPPQRTAKPEPTLEDKLTSLSNRFRTR